MMGTQNMKTIMVILILLSVASMGIFFFQIRNEKEETVLFSAPVLTSYPSPTVIPYLSPRPTVLTKNIIVSSPVSGQFVSGSFTIVGEARVFENVVSLRVTDITTGRVLRQTTAYASAPDVGQFRPFVLRLEIPSTVQSGDKLTVEAYQASPKDGSEIDKVSIPIRVK